MIASLAGSLGLDITDPAFWIPLLLMAMLFALILGGALFDGFDIGVGLLLRAAPLSHRAQMMVVLSPWRDANEFWLLLAVGLFMSAFPLGWGAVLAHLFVPVMIVLVGVMLRSVAFEFRIRAAIEQRMRWMNYFWFGFSIFFTIFVSYYNLFTRIIPSSWRTVITNTNNSIIFYHNSADLKSHRG